MARAAQQALNRGNNAAAAGYAQRAVQAAPQNAKLWFLLGYTSRLAGRLQPSLDAYKSGLQREPGSLDGLSGMAQTYARMGNISEAKRLLTQVVNANPKRVNDVLVLGEMQMRSGDLQQGLQTLQRGEAMKPSAHAELLMAMAYMKMKQPEKAKQLLDAAKRRAPRNPEIFRAVANYYRETRDYRAAIATLKSAPRQSPEVLADMAYTYELEGDHKQAAATYVRAANEAPKVIGYQLSAAQAQIVAGDADSGKKFLARAAALDESHYRLHAIRATVAKQEERRADAIREYEFAIAHLPESVAEGQLYPVLLRMNLAELYREDGNEAAAQRQLAMAEQQMTKIQVEGPAKAEFLRVRASIRTGSNDFSGAEADLKQALALDPANTNAQLQYANLLWKTRRPDEARKMYTAVLARDAKNRYALESMGYLARELGDNKTAAEFFNRLAAAYPNDYVPYLALGDMFTATREFAPADANYNKAFRLAPRNPTIIANAANAAIESRQFPRAGEWLARATAGMSNSPRIMLQRERYLFHTGKYLESAQLGRRVLEQLPRDRNASVYLGYALYNLGRYDDVLALSNQYESILPREPNFPLLAGHVHKQSQLLDEAADDYGRAIARDPKMVEAYINRGYTLNDLQNAEAATQDFNTALKINPGNGTAHLGLAFANLQLRRGKQALDQAQEAAKLMGDSGAIHLARATAFRQMRVLDKAEQEYRAALKYAPDDLSLHLALGETLYHEHRYNESIQALKAALPLSPDDSMIYAGLAHAAARLHDRNATLNYVQSAEREGGDEAAVLLATGDALLTLGEREAAMQRFTRALEAPDADKVDVRLAIGKVFLRDGKWDDARQQIALGFAESRVGESAPVSADNLIEAANMFLAMHDFDLAQRYYRKAKGLGAGDEVVAIGMANSYLAQGNALQAQSQLDALGNGDDYASNYDYALAQANIHRQRRDNVRAITAYARANALSGEEDVAERALQEVAGEEGFRLNDRWSVLSTFNIEPIFEDETIYQTDAQVFGVANDPALLPPPRSSLQTTWTNAFRMHQQGFPLVSGFFQVRNARGQVSVPSLALILDRNTYDYNFNGAINPVLHMGRNTIAFNTGLQFTLRRDSGSLQSAIALDQNLFRQFVYMSTSSFGNWISARGGAYHEAGPFTIRKLSSRDLGAHLDFRVGRPWGNTALVTGYSVRDLQFSPLVREFFTTSTYAGIERQFMDRKLKVTALGEYIRSWRVQDLTFGLGQTMRPAGEVEYRPNNRWLFEGTFAYSRGEGFHAYDNMQSGFLISYVKPLRRSIDDGAGPVPVEYPLRLSFGIQQQTFFNFTGRDQTHFRPVVRLTLF